jgi:hypothetical protein
LQEGPGNDGFSRLSKAKLYFEGEISYWNDFRANESAIIFSAKTFDLLENLYLESINFCVKVRRKFNPKYNPKLFQKQGVETSNLKKFMEILRFEVMCRFFGALFARIQVKSRRNIIDSR